MFRYLTPFLIIDEQKGNTKTTDDAFVGKKSNQADAKKNVVKGGNAAPEVKKMAGGKK